MVKMVNVISGDMLIKDKMLINKPHLIASEAVVEEEVSESVVEVGTKSD